MTMDMEKFEAFQELLCEGNVRNNILLLAIIIGAIFREIEPKMAERLALSIAHDICRSHYSTQHESITDFSDSDLAESYPTLIEAMAKIGEQIKEKPLAPMTIEELSRLRLPKDELVTPILATHIGFLVADKPMEEVKNIVMKVAALIFRTHWRCHHGGELDETEFAAAFASDSWKQP